MTRPEATECGVCGRPVQDGGWLCDGAGGPAGSCTTLLRTQLESIPDLLAELDHTALRQARVGDDDGPGDPGLPWNEHAAGLARHVRDLTRALAVRLLRDTGRFCGHRSCRALGGARRGPVCAGWSDTSVAAHAPAVWVARNIALLRRRPWATYAANAVASAITTGWQAVDRPEQRYYAGPCPTEHPDPARPGELVLCGRILWARLDQPAVSCAGCGVQHPVIERREFLLAAAHDVHATATDIASALTLMTRTRVPAVTIRSWASRGRLTATGTTTDGRPTYRVGDVLALLAAAPDTESEAS